MLIIDAFPASHPIGNGLRVVTYSTTYCNIIVVQGEREKVRYGFCILPNHEAEDYRGVGERKRLHRRGRAIGTVG
jgi:hypothetical protein